MNIRKNSRALAEREMSAMVNVMTSRREFLAGFAAFAAMRSLPADAATREYYVKYLDAITRKIETNAERKGARGGFFFYADSHVLSNHGQSGFVMADLVGRTGIGRVFGGGDYSVLHCKDDPKEAMERILKLHRECWRDPVEAAGGSFYAAKGNHDLIVFRKDSEKKSGFGYSSRHAREILMDTAAVRRAASNPDDGHGVYFYTDDLSAQVRYIVADTSDGVRESDCDPKGLWLGIKMRQIQLDWLRDKAFGTMPEGWRAVVMQHVPLAAVTIGRDEYIERFTPFRELMEKEAARGRMLADLSGHHHCDRFTHWRGLLHISLSCDCHYRDAELLTPFCGTMAGKKKGTTNEQAFDCFQPCGDLLFATRIGQGTDRVFHVKPLEMKTGDRLRLEAKELEGPLSWTVFDADAFTEIKGPGLMGDQRCQFTRSYASVSEKGEVSALRPGDVTVLAMDRMFNKEIFGIRIS